MSVYRLDRKRKVIDDKTKTAEVYLYTQIGRGKLNESTTETAPYSLQN